MNKVIPKAGQVWECVKDELWNTNYGDKAKISKVGNDAVHYNSSMMSAKAFNRCFKFIPQNDLEWLAVNEPEWFHDDCSHIRRKQEAVMYTDCPERKLIAHHNWHAKQQWQNMRYELGLDEKPERSGLEAFAMGLGVPAPIRINCPCTTAPLPEVPAHMYCRCSTKLPLELKKDTKMIDLSPAKSGDKFVLNNGTIVTFFARTLMNSICTLDSGHAMVYHHNGKFDESVEPNDNKSNWDIVSKHDPRHWLSQLPDADLFKLYQTSDIVCNQFGVWVANSLGAPALTLSGNMMPKLTGDEYKLSKISIVELKAWQVANKRAQGGPIKPGTAYIVGESGGPDVPVPAGPIVEANDD